MRELRVFDVLFALLAAPVEAKVVNIDTLTRAHPFLTIARLVYHLVYHGIKVCVGFSCALSVFVSVCAYASKWSAL